MKHIATFLTCILLACDFVVPGECLSPGYMFGPCVNYICEEDRLTCMATPQGDQCVVRTDAVDQDEAEACAVWRGDLGTDANGHFVVSCREDIDACTGGTVCSSGLCVYPRWGQVKAGQVCSWDEECVDGLVCPSKDEPIDGVWGLCVAP